jgi:hypothetical protein
MDTSLVGMLEARGFLASPFFYLVERFCGQPTTLSRVWVLSL